MVPKCCKAQARALLSPTGFEEQTTCVSLMWWEGRIPSEHWMELGFQPLTARVPGIATRMRAHPAGRIGVRKHGVAR